MFLCVLYIGDFALRLICDQDDWNILFLFRANWKTVNSQESFNDFYFVLSVLIVEWFLDNGV